MASESIPPDVTVVPPLSIHDLTVAYQRKPVIWDIDYVAPAGKLVAIVGPNGAGKSTLINAALELIPRASGQVRFFGEPYQKQRHRVGYVPQRESVDWDFPVSALDVVVMGLYRKVGWCLPVLPRHRKTALAALARVGMADYAHRQIRRLSGGQQQQLAIARALLLKPKLLILDEPTEGIQPSIIKDIGSVIKLLRDRGEMAIVLVEQYLDFAAELADEFIILERGRVVASGAGSELASSQQAKELLAI